MKDCPPWVAGRRALVVSLLDDRIRIHTRRKRSWELLFEDIRTLRYVVTESPQRSDYALLIEGKGRTIALNFMKTRIAGADPVREVAFNYVVSKTLAAIAVARPELEVSSGRAPLGAALNFLCFVISAALGIDIGILLLGERDARQIGLAALGIVSLVFA
nr:hypothetical protein [uncultured Hyphomonas sp.]